MLKILLFLIPVTGVIGWALYATGFFFKTTIESITTPTYTLIYKSLTGPYQQSGKAMDEVYYWLQKQNVNSTKGFGYYFDSPKEVSQKELRCIVGCIIEQKDLKKVEKANESYSLASFPTQACIQATFPYHGNHQLIAGIIKVYPLLQEQAKKLDCYYQVMEIYDIPNKKRLFLLSRDRQFDAAKLYFNK